MKKPMIKALAMTLAVTMAFSAPLTASATGLADLFSPKTVSEGKTPDDPNKTPDDPNKTPDDPNKTPDDPNKTPDDPNKTPDDPNKTPDDPNKTPDDPNKTPDDPNKTPDDPNKTPDDPDDIPASVYEGKFTILGLTLDKTELRLDEDDWSDYVKTYYGELEATVLMESNQTDRSGKAITVAVNSSNVNKFKEATVNVDGEEVGVEKVLQSIGWNSDPKEIVKLIAYEDDPYYNSLVGVFALDGGRTKVTAKLNEFTATADVKVIFYSQKLEIKDLPTIYKGHEYDLSGCIVQYLDKEGKRPGGTDDVTWELRGVNTKNGKAVNPKAYATITPDGKLTAKKVTDGKMDITIAAVSEHGATATAKLTIEAGTPATAVTIAEGKSKDFDLGNAERVETVTFTATATPANSTDDIIWTSNDKKGIVEFEQTETENGSSTVTITPKKVGTVTFTAKATSGKKATIKLKVTANQLRGITALNFSNNKNYAFQGQKVSVVAVTDPVQYTGKFTYELNTAAENYADVSSKIKLAKTGKVSYVKNAEITEPLTVSVKITAKTKGATIPAGQELQTVELRKNPITGINSVQPGDGFVVFSGKTRTFTAALQGELPEGTTENDFVTWTVNNKKAASIDSEGVLTALASGKATVTASVTDAKGKTFKKTAKGQINTVATKVVINTPNVIKYETGKKQTVTLKASVPKGLGDAIKKGDGTTWSIKNYKYVVNEAGYLVLTELSPSEANITLGTDNASSVKVLISENAKIYEWAEVTVTTKYGASATATVQVADKITDVSWAVKTTDGAATGMSPAATAAGITADAKYKKFSVTINRGDSINIGRPALQVYCTPVDKNRENVYSGFDNLTYSANNNNVSVKDGIVWGLRPGNTKITVTAAGGKKIVLDVTVNEVTD